jgi:predicted dehydrogenase
LKTLRVGVIGCGHLGRIHARLLAGADGAKLAAVADPIADSRRQAAGDSGAAQLADYGDLIGQIDAAIVAAPATLHHAIGMELLRHGIHVLMEKPLAVTAAEAEELVWAAHWHGAILQVGHIEQFNPALQQVLPLVQNARLIEATRAGGYTFRSTDIGVVLDLMIHDLDIALSLVRSPVKNVRALGLCVMGGHEDVAQAWIEFANGCVAQLSASRVSYRPRREMQVWSPHAQVEIDFAERRTTAVEPVDTLVDFDFHERNISADERQHLQKNLFAELLPARQQEAPAQNALVEEQRDFIESIRTGRTPRVSGEQGCAVIAVAERVLSSIAEHRWDDEISMSAAGPLRIFAASEPRILRSRHWQRPSHDAPGPFRRKEAG